MLDRSGSGPPSRRGRTERGVLLLILLSAGCERGCLNQPAVGRDCARDGECFRFEICDDEVGRCVIGCRDDSVCSAGYRCLPRSRLCGETCVVDADCAAGYLCQTYPAPRCEPRCDAQGAPRCAVGSYCGDGGRCRSGCLGPEDCGRGNFCEPPDGGGICRVRECDVDSPCGSGMHCDVPLGQCVRCLVDAHCLDPKLPVCDPTLRACSACLSTPDTCPTGSYCASRGPARACLPGCLDDTDCAGPTPFCEGPGSHRCVECVGDAGCPLDQICVGSSCRSGCSALRPCAAGLACCQSQCTTLESDYQNCGACGVACPGGYNCCAGACSNPSADPLNCGGCGMACPVGQACMARQCL